MRKNYERVIKSCMTRKKKDQYKQFVQCSEKEEKGQAGKISQNSNTTPLEHPVFERILTSDETDVIVADVTQKLPTATNCHRK